MYTSSDPRKNVFLCPETHGLKRNTPDAESQPNQPAQPAQATQPTSPVQPASQSARSNQAQANAASQPSPANQPKSSQLATLHSSAKLRPVPKLLWIRSLPRTFRNTVCRALVNERRNMELQIFQVLRRAYPHSFELKRRRAQTTTMKLAAVLCAVTSVTQTARAVPTESSVLKTLDNVYDEAVPPDEHYLEFRADYVELM